MPQHSGGNGAMSMDSPEMIDYRLKQEEQLINLKILHKMDRESCAKKQNRFRRTVLAVYNIVSQKLYKRKASSVEVYFREAWRISRAQVYRFLDCAEVLKQLEDFPEQPCKERLCRSLKRLAHNRENIRILWVSVLKRVTNSNQTVTSTVISSVWEELLKNRLVSIQKDTKTRKSGDKTKSSSRGYNKYSRDKPANKNGGSVSDKLISPTPRDDKSPGSNQISKWSIFNPDLETHHPNKSLSIVSNPNDNTMNGLQASHRYDGNLNAADPLQEMMSSASDGKCSPVIPQWSSKSLCSVESLYHRGGVSMGSYVPHDPKLSCSPSPSVPYSINADSYWEEFRNFQNKEGMTQSGIPPVRSNNVYNVDAHIAEASIGYSRVSEPQAKSLGRVQGLSSSPIHHSQMDPNSPITIGEFSAKYESLLKNSVWLIQYYNADKGIYQTPQLEGQDGSNISQIHHYCQSYPTPSSVSTCKSHIQIKTPPKHKEFPYCDICCSPSPAMSSDQMKPHLNTIFCPNKSPWLNDYPQEYLMMQKKSQLISQSQVASTSMNPDVFSPVQILHKIDQPYDDLAKLSPQIGHAAVQGRAHSQYNHVAPLSLQTPTLSYDLSTDSWCDPVCGKTRTSMDQCGRTSFSDFCSNDPLLYCNN